MPSKAPQALARDPRFLGDVPYSAYLVHWTVESGAFFLSRALFGGDLTGPEAVLFIGGTMVAGIALAATTHRRLEMPAPR